MIHLDHAEIGTAVTILGTGAMGTALARRLLKRGHPVTVWNRNADKAAVLADDGAIIAASVREAVQASPIVITCFLNMNVATAVLDSPDASSLLAGRIVVTTETATPSEVRDFQHFVTTRSAKHVDVKLMLYPAQIGTPEAILYLAGDETSVEEVQPVFAEIAGNPLVIGTDIVAAAVMYNAVWTYYFAGLFGFLEALAFVQRSGAPVDVFLAQTRPATHDLTLHLAEATRRVTSGDLSGDQATVGVYVDGFSTMRGAFLDSGIDSRVLKALHALSQMAAEKGHENHDITAVATALRD